MKRKQVVITIATVLTIASAVAGVLWFEIAGNKLYTYNLSVAEKNYTITVTTNWNSEPKIYQSDSSLTDLKYLSIDFIGSSRKSVSFKATFPTELLLGNISLVWKYYQQSPDRYELFTNGDYTSVQMAFTHIAINEHFEIHGEDGAW